MKVSILGTEYEIITGDANGSEFNCKYGYCYPCAKEIHVEDLHTDNEWKNEPEHVITSRSNQTLRHEIIHAFLYESGLHADSSDVRQWALNEEMIDWMAMQLPKILKVFKEAGCLE